MWPIPAFLQRAGEAEDLQPRERRARDDRRSAALSMLCTTWIVYSTYAVGKHFYPEAVDQAVWKVRDALSGVFGGLDPRVDEAALQQGQARVLDHFGSYIDPQHPCFEAVASLSTSVRYGDAGGFNPSTNTLVVSSRLAPDTGQAVATHEYLHCFTHSNFEAFAFKHPHRRVITEGITQYLTHQIMGEQRVENDYDNARVSTPERLTWTNVGDRAAQAIGEVTLMEAYFGGNEAAIRQLNDTLFHLLPKTAVAQAWNALQVAGGPTYVQRPEKLAEMYVGALMIHNPKSASQGIQHLIESLPPQAREQFREIISRLATELSDTDPRHPKNIAGQIQQQAIALRQRVGPEKFDLAFCRDDLDPKVRKQLMRELASQWQPVLPRELAALLSQARPGSGQST